MDELKLISWNVNGIRAVIKNGFINSINLLNPDILCIQETKANKNQVNLDIEKLGFKYEFWNSAEKKGYSGTAIFSKIKPENVKFGLGIEKYDREGRVITLEFKNFFLVNVYTPNSKRGLERLDFRYKEWDVEFLKFISKLDKIKPVVFCGDLNAAHREIDVKNDKANKTTEKNPGHAGFTDKEREGITKIIKAGFIDSYRFFHPNNEKFTWWSYMFSSRKKNIGWRIDYFFVSKKLKNNLKYAEINDNILGSDHCPVEIWLKF